MISTRGFFLHEVRHVLWLEHFTSHKRTARTAAQATQVLSQLPENDLLSYCLMSQAILRQMVVIEEVPEGAMADIM
jgi:hypothetical protein